MQVEFPDDLRRYLTRHDGSGDFFISPYKIGGGGQMLMALEGIVAIWHHLVDAAVDLEKSGEFGEQIGPVKQNYWNRRWVPFTENGCGDYIFVDLDPGNDGTVGQIVDWWHEKAQSTFQSASLREWLNEVVGEIKKGVYTFGNT
jgi:cell wall assembly regulator SMI1